MFDNLIPIVLKACEPKVMPQKGTGAGNDFSLDSDSEDEYELAKVQAMKATEYDEKSAAIHALGELASACPTKFAPYF